MASNACKHDLLAGDGSGRARDREDDGCVEIHKLGAGKE